VLAGPVRISHIYVTMEQRVATAQDPAVSETDGTVSIELNFKAFADGVPTHQHAKRAPGRGDPSIQDFADQALEFAALRAELKRLMRDYEVLQQQAAAREARLDELRRELTATRAQLREERRQQSQAFAEVTIAQEPPHVGPQLIPLDRSDSPVALSREIVTIGRTSQSDLCIRSSAVSRDHARLLIAPGSVTLVDVSSTNGCFVNDEPVKKQRLRDGDLVRIGDRSFRFVCGMPAGSVAP
jgi:pSer/pThr/pTyr-binding forkhead associated (FHA) protein